MIKLQVAIDRVSLDYAVEMANKLDGIADIIEFGTSIVKDYGLIEIANKKLNLKKSKLFFDLKTIDEGSYEFKQGYKYGGDVLSVMGASAKDTIAQVYDVAQANGEDIFIDLMGTNDQKISQIKEFDNAIYGIHHAKDSENNFDAVATVADFHSKYPDIKRISVAGGIDLESASKLSEQNIVDSVIVGGKILNAENPVETAKQFREVLK